MKKPTRIKRTRQDVDPTGQAGNRQNANRDNNRRLNNAARRVLNLWKDIESKRTVRQQIVNETLDFYLYDLNDEELFKLAASIEAIINDELETEDEEVPVDWYYSQYVETATRSGVIQENNWIQNILTGVAIGFLLDSAILKSTAYIEFLDQQILKNYRDLKGLSATTSKQVFQVISQGMDAGLGKTAIQRQILERFEVGKSSSRRIVNTEINKAYNDSRMNVVEFYRSQGAPVAVMHISALLTTTRPHHASRHGLAYTPEQQKRWWDSNHNRIHCHCKAQAVRLDSNGQVENKVAQDRIIQRGKDWFESN